MFSLIVKGEHGDTVFVAEPKIEAYKSMALIARMGRRYSLVCHADGQYTVHGDGLAPLTFAPEDATVPV